MVQDKKRVVQDIRKQVAAIKSVAASLEKEVMDFPSRILDLYRFPMDRRFGFESMNWWKILFHIAHHYSPALRDASRQRWVNVFDGAPEAGDGQATPPAIPSTDKIREFHFQIEDVVTLWDDIWPGTIWCELSEDIFTSTKQAIDLLIHMVEQADVVHPPPEVKAFAQLLKKFEALATKDETARALAAIPTKQDDDGDEEYYARYDPVLLRIGSPFTTPAVGQWCDTFSPIADKFIELSRWHNFAEVVTFRHMPPEFERLCEAAGELLPRELGVVTLMSPGRRGDGQSDFVVVSSATTARWIRFVFDTLRRKFSGEVIEHFPPAEYIGKPQPWAPYGYLRLKNGFFRASAMVIRDNAFAVDLSAKSHATTISKAESVKGTPIRGKSGSYLDSLLKQLEVADEIKEKIRGLQSSHGTAIAEFLVAEQALQANEWDRKVTIAEAHLWLTVDFGGSKILKDTWGRSVSKARKEVPELRVNRRLKPRGDPKAKPSSTTG